jgi:hypothetical protein
VRLQVASHATTALVRRLPAPRPPDGSPQLRAIADLARQLASGHRGEAPLQARVAALYGLARDDFAYVLSSFPLVDEAVRREALVCYSRY